MPAQHKRRHGRVKQPVEVTVAGQVYRTDDWSIGGFSVSGEVLLAGEAAPVQASIHFDGLTFIFTMRAQRVFALPDRTGFQFIDLSQAQLDLLRALIISDVSGQAFPLAQLLVVPGNYEAVEAARQSGRAEAEGIAVIVEG